MFAKLRVSWAAVFVGGLALLAASPMLPSAFPALSLGAIPGRVLYVSLLLAMVGGYIVAETRADTTRRREQKERDDLSGARHFDDMAATARLEALVTPELQKLSLTLASIAFDMNRGVPANSPQIQELVESARSSAATIGNIVIRPGTGELILTGYAPEITFSPVKSTGAQQP